jgi:O-antigen/teichoic acid export membrane protein
LLDIKRIEWPERRVAGSLFRFGGWMLVSSITGMLTDTLDRVILGASLGARFVTYYTVPQNLVTRLNMLPNAMVRTLFPRLSAIERRDADGMAASSLEFLNGVFTPIAIFALLALEPFLHVWIGADLALESAPVGRILVIAVWLVGQAGVTRILIQSQLNPASAARAGLLQLPFFVALLWFGIQQFGPVGAASVVAFRALADYAVLLWMTRVKARPIALDMLAHLTFLISSLVLGSLIDAMEHPFQAIAAALLVALSNAGWSVLTRPALRALASAVIRKLSARIGRRIHSPMKARSDA